ncbi:GNAT family N-acetyltransferase [Ferruginibacter sp. HRS2-29]|uniref:GNAT family N-acetyltransferase n=1 Tax=Ferruginibacter sp. HRS2-29 TaxID=2487334 RepID=UPI0020CD6309|nr:GNAT family N-acetyltransferase [Ferruginibacter sp. HRS2-29]MCP9752407.1 GNAT family N-acetyltransferase [Ferruginibacter sp. HRS2-29]
MEDVIIRKAVVGDMETLLKFEQGVIGSERPFDPTLKTADAKYYDLPKMIHSGHIELLVAAVDGKPIASGYARIEASELFLQHTQHAYLGFMYVLPEYRGRGINRLMINRLMEWAKAKGITEFRLEVYSGNSAAIRAYEKVGFVRHMIEMRRGG